MTVTTLAPQLRRMAHWSSGFAMADVLGRGANDPGGACRDLRALGFRSLLLAYESLGEAAASAVVQAGRDADLCILADVHAPSDTAGGGWDRWLAGIEERAGRGISGLRCLAPGSLSAQQWHHVRVSLAARFPDLLVTLWTPGEPAQRLAALADAGFDAVYSSLAWWDQRSPWLVREAAGLRQLAPVIAPLAVRRAGVLDPRLIVDDSVMLQRMWVARYLGHGLMADADRALSPAFSSALMELDDVTADLDTAVTGTGTAATGLDGTATRLGGAAVDMVPVADPLRILTGPLAPSTQLFRPDAGRALILHDHEPEALRTALRLLAARLPGALGVAGSRIRQAALGTRAVSMVDVERRPHVRARHVSVRNGGTDPGLQRTSDAQAALRRALDADRVVVDQVTPHVDQGRFAVKLLLGRALEVSATVFADGHAHLGVCLLWRAADEPQWRSTAMRPLGNDRWAASVVPDRLGRHYYMVQAWMENGEPRHRTRQSIEFPLQVERYEAEFGNWYELFPRSMGAAGEHGTLRDVIKALPRIRAMGFDVLYFPPIHPIGHTNRKGRNNTLTAQSGDPGSPYAIGAETGGHTALHPSLGTLQDFHDLRDAARHCGLELALDFAIQCSPDHPWLREHPEWFRWREDGTVQYAENPPKRYEDIVNPDFYSATAGVRQRMALWRELRDVVLFWVDQGLRIFRVDNPHTKPLPFWEWMIAEVTRHHPDVVFLSEAFTRPAMMHRLAKLGFSQSYTYFTWRNTKAELTDYLTELSRSPEADYFRPNFFVNTPDINPYFLQTSGRAGFLIRAALATTTSGLWGMYSGFELCESEALPGREEYQDSEKYELRHRDWDQPGNIAREIAELNAMRRDNPALQTHRGICFHAVDDDRVLYFSRTSAERDNMVLAAISLSPHDTVHVRLDIPVRSGSAGTRAGVRLRSMDDGHVVTVSPGGLPVILHPGRPYVLWSVLP